MLNAYHAAVGPVESPGARTLGYFRRAVRAQASSKSASPNPTPLILLFFLLYIISKYALAGRTQRLLRALPDNTQERCCVSAMSITAKPGAGSMPTSVVNPSAMKKKPYPLWLGGRS